jgi:hypothetical protein
VFDWLTLAYPAGDTGILGSAISQLQSGSQGIGGIYNQFSGSAARATDQWDGVAELAFSSKGSALRGHLNSVAGAHGGIASALNTYLQTLEGAQSSSRQAQGIISEAIGTYQHQGQSTAWRLASDIELAIKDIPFSGMADYFLNRLRSWVLPSIYMAGLEETTAPFPDFSVESILYDVESGFGGGLSTLLSEIPGIIVDLLGDTRSVAESLERDFAASVSTAHRMANQAVSDVTGAAEVAARTVTAIGSEVFRNISIGGAASVLNVLGFLGELPAIFGTGKASNDLRLAIDALRTGEISELEELDPEAYDAVEAVAGVFGEDSPEALEAWMEFQEGIVPQLADDIPKAFSGVDALSEDGIGGLLGRAGLVLGAASDVFTLADSHSSGLDKVMSGANLAGTGAFALGATGIIGANAALDWIPVAGEVVMGATALFMAGEFAAHHWSQIEGASKDVLGGVEWLGNEEVNLAGDAVGAVTHVAGDAVGDVTHVAANVGAGVVHGGEDVGHDIASIF